MAENSDTDSDSQSSVLANAEDISYPAFPSSPDSLEPGAISQIIQNLLHQPLAPFQYEEIETASSTLVRFIDDISSRLKNDANVVEVLTTFSLLGMSVTLVAKKEKCNPYLIVKPAFLNKLFEYRLFYQDATSQTNGKTLNSTLVTWVDVLLASLSFATMAVAGATSEIQFLDQGVSETIRLQKRHDSIRAATQLPGKAFLKRKI